MYNDMLAHYFRVLVKSYETMVIPIDFNDMAVRAKACADLAMINYLEVYK